MTYNDFYNQYKGQTNVGNTAINLGECVGLVSVWMDNLGIPHEWGNAKDLYANADPKFLAQIPNDPTAIPQQGDIIVWSGAFNGGVGHTGIASGKADVNTFECFEQNDPIGSTPHLKTYNYAYVTGWLRPKTPVTDAVSVPKATFEDLVRKSGEYDAVCKTFGFDNTSNQSGNIKDAFEKLKSDLQSCQATINQAADISPKDSTNVVPEPVNGDSTTNTVGGNTTVPGGDSTSAVPGDNPGSGDSPEVVSQTTKGFDLFAFIQSLLVKVRGWFK